mmetsp:Transcript_9586/g.33678  ORF Transcript_9586/g.33678 Transcript_9586/m.33678 type:complete len:370 (-) Transcript_9586:753-1862(-)
MHVKSEEPLHTLPRPFHARHCTPPACCRASATILRAALRASKMRMGPRSVPAHTCDRTRAMQLMTACVSMVATSSAVSASRTTTSPSRVAVHTSPSTTTAHLTSAPSIVLTSRPPCTAGGFGAPRRFALDAAAAVLAAERKAAMPRAEPPFLNMAVALPALVTDDGVASPLLLAALGDADAVCGRRVRERTLGTAAGAERAIISTVLSDGASNGDSRGTLSAVTAKGAVPSSSSSSSSSAAAARGVAIASATGVAATAVASTSWPRSMFGTGTCSSNVRLLALKLDARRAADATAAAETFGLGCGGGTVNLPGGATVGDTVAVDGGRCALARRAERGVSCPPPPSSGASTAPPAPRLSRSRCPAVGLRR